MKKIENKYVVLDVETNGLSSVYDDLLSISIYKPDDNKMYNRFLPLELNSAVYTTYINGIKDEDLKGKEPLSQEEVDNLIKEYELDSRTILTYGNIDEKFIKNYFKRKKLRGFSLFTFYNFKHDIISSSFSGGNITKDNLCNLYGIGNVQKVHTGSNDCLLEWNLFKKMNGNKLLVTNDDVFELNNEYIIPASYLSTYPNFKYCLDDFPKFECDIKIVKEIRIKTDYLKRFETNISGITIEHLINSMLDVKEIDSSKFLIKNKSKLKYIGRLPSVYDELLVNLNRDGTISAVREKDEEKVKNINKAILDLKSRIVPLINYIKKDIFSDTEILSQELVVSDDKKVLAVCDLSNSNNVLEIKTYSFKLEKMKYQLYYESNGRNCYVLTMNWSSSSKSVKFIISQITFKAKKSLKNNKENIKAKKKPIRIDYNEKTNCRTIEIIYDYKNGLVKVQCAKCSKKWDTTYSYSKQMKECPFCLD